MQGIPLAVIMTERFLDGNGAAGARRRLEETIQAYVPKARFDDYRQFMERVFGAPDRSSPWNSAGPVCQGCGRSDWTEDLIKIS